MKFKDILIYATVLRINQQLNRKYKTESFTAEHISDGWVPSRSEERRCVYDVYTISALDRIRVRLYCNPSEITYVAKLSHSLDPELKAFEDEYLFTANASISFDYFFFDNNEVRQSCPKLDVDIVVNEDDLYVLLQEETPPILLENGEYIFFEDR